MLDVLYVNLFNDYSYYTEVDLFGVQVILNVGYNSRAGLRYISVTSEDGSITYLRPTFIKKNSNVYFNNNFRVFDHIVTVSLSNINENKYTPEDYVNWKDYYRLAFIVEPIE